MNLFVILVIVGFGNAGAHHNRTYKRRFVDNKTGMPVQPECEGGRE
jgi:hypothetical protein